MIQSSFPWIFGGVCLQGKMALSIILLLVLVVFQGANGFQIDCGVAGYGYMDDNGTTWLSDEDFYGYGGINAKVLVNTTIQSQQMNTLRFFPDRNKVCYILPVSSHEKSLIRAAFYYGNYDGLSNPPTFDLQLDGNKWDTIVTSLDQPIFKEVIIKPSRESSSVCIAQTYDKEVIFISSLEVVDLPDSMYRWMDPTHALFKEYRLNFGANETIEYPYDEYYRIWDPIDPSGYKKIIANFSSLNSTVDEYPPPEVVVTAVEASSPSDEINLSFNLPQIQRPRYVILYFTEVEKLKPNQNRTFDVHIDEQQLGTLSPRYQMCDKIEGLTLPKNGSLNLTLSTSANSNMPPSLSAFELFTVVDYQVQETSAQDLEGLKGLTSYASSTHFRGWGGDPCLPANSTFQWLRCNEENPPRVTAIYLSGYELIGGIGDFRQMDALQIIDLHNNSLQGTIPEFLGTLPNLKVLNLANNKLRGRVPKSLFNGKILLNVDGNPDLILHERKKMPISIHTIVLLVVVCFTAFLCIFGNCICLISAREKTKEEGVQHTKQVWAEEIIHV